MTDLPWIQCAPSLPYFAADRGDPWTSIGQNDSTP